MQVAKNGARTYAVVLQRNRVRGMRCWGWRYAAGMSRWNCYFAAPVQAQTVLVWSVHAVKVWVMLLRLATCSMFATATQQHWLGFCCYSLPHCHCRQLELFWMLTSHMTTPLVHTVLYANTTKLFILSLHDPVWQRHAWH